MSEKQGLYLYCLADSECLKEVSGTGIDDKNELFIKNTNNIAVVLSKVALNDFIGNEAEERLQDINWIGPKALRHQDIIAQIMESSPILPARFGTIFSTDEEMDRLFDCHTQTIKEFLSKIRNHQEWSVKGYLDKKKLLKLQAKTEIEKNQEMLSQMSPGKRYFQEKKIQKLVEKELEKHIKDLIQMIADRLDAVSSDAAELKLLSRQASGEDIDMIFNEAFLVNTSQIDVFHQNIDNLRQEIQVSGAVLKLSGPWPPYSFCPNIEINSG